MSAGITDWVSAQIRDYQLREQVAKDAHDKAVARASTAESELARLREELTDARVKTYLRGQSLEDVRRERDALRARVTDLEHDRNISAASADLLAGDVKEAQDRMAKAEARAERLADAAKPFMEWCDTGTPTNISDFAEHLRAALADQPAQASTNEDTARLNWLDSFDSDAWWNDQNNPGSRGGLRINIDAARKAGA